MAIQIDERFVIGAPVEPVWDFLVDPRRVVACVPGGELAEVADERNFRGKVKVIVGPLTLAYGGRIRLADVDVAARRVKIVGLARESAGEDSARLSLESWLTALPDGSTEVVALARVDVAGAILDLGRGFLEQLGHLVFQDFSRCVRETIEAEHAGRATLPLAAAAGGAAGAPNTAGAANVGAASAPGRSAPAAPRPPLHAIPLVFRALGAWAAGALRTHRDRRLRAARVERRPGGRGVGGGGVPAA